MTASGIAW